MKPFLLSNFIFMCGMCLCQASNTSVQNPTDSVKVKTQKISKTSRIEKKVIIQRDPARKESQGKNN
jgi:hypothetical protein